MTRALLKEEVLVHCGEAHRSLSSTLQSQVTAKTSTTRYADLSSAMFNTSVSISSHTLVEFPQQPYIIVKRINN